MEGLEIGNWRLEQKIGEGGMGEVYLAHHKILETPAAVKVISPALTHDPKVRDRFFREARTQANLRHPNIVQVLDYLEHDGRWFLIAEYLEKGSLADLLKGRAGPVAIDRALDWGLEALRALDFAHQRGIIHRDVKPSNLLLDAGETLKVTDFGIALVLGGRKLTTTGQALGTPQYMSPEQIRHPQDVDHRSDVYSMGIVLYELLTGSVPFGSDTDSDFEIQSAQVSSNPQPLRERNATIPEALEPIVLRALAKDPDRRYSGCGELARAIEALRQAGAPAVTAEAARARPERIVPEESLERQARQAAPSAARPNRTNRWLVLLLAVTAVGLLALAAALSKSRDEVDRERGEHRAALARLQGEAATESKGLSEKLGWATELAAARAWPSAATETFTDCQYRWFLGVFTDQRAVGNFSCGAGRYLWQVSAIQNLGLHQRRLGLYSLPRRFLLSAESKPLKGPDGVKVGVQFNMQGNGDVYEFSGHGNTFTFWSLRGGQWQELKSARAVASVRIGSTSRLTVLARNSDFKFFVDDQYLFDFSDTRLEGGTAGLAISLNAGESATLEFDNFELRSPDADALSGL